MDFFQVPLNLPKMPDWIHKPSAEIGVLVPHAAVIARSDQALVALAGFHVNSQGVEILLMLRTLSEFVLEDPTGFRELMRRRIDPTNDSLPLTLVCEYPQVAIALTRYEIEAAPLLQAASQSIKLWEDAT
jgi:hypothetical protein